jgi:preprotein translocase subunit SecG
VTDHRVTGRTLITIAIAVALLTVILWQKATQDADDERIEESYRAISEGRPIPEGSTDRTLPLAAGGVAAVLFLGGIILVATTNREEDH